MAWLETHQSLGQHPKLFRLAEELKINSAQAIGHLLYMWWWALDYAPNGDLSKFSAAEISCAARWPGDGSAFSAAIKKCLWIDLNGNIHDWIDYAGHYLLGRERQKRYRDRRHALRNGDVTMTTTIPTNQPYQPTIPTNIGGYKLGPHHTTTKRFDKPTPEQVTAYAKDELGFVLDGDRFCDFYESKGWVVGRSPMKSWQAAVRNWKKRGGAGLGQNKFNPGVAGSKVGATGGFVVTKQPLF